jgi:hypothetical protein
VTILKASRARTSVNIARCQFFGFSLDEIGAGWVVTIKFDDVALSVFHHPCNFAKHPQAYLHIVDRGSTCGLF